MKEVLNKKVKKKKPVKQIFQYDLSDDYADLVKVECNICSKEVEQDQFR